MVGLTGITFALTSASNDIFKEDLRTEEHTWGNIFALATSSYFAVVAAAPIQRSQSSGPFEQSLLYSCSTILRYTTSLYLSVIIAARLWKRFSGVISKGDVRLKVDLKPCPSLSCFFGPQCPSVRARTCSFWHFTRLCISKLKFVVYLNILEHVIIVTSRSCTRILIFIPARAVELFIPARAVELVRKALDSRVFVHHAHFI